MSSQSPQDSRIEINRRILRVRYAQESDNNLLKFLEIEYANARGLDKLHWERSLGFEYSFFRESKKSNEIFMTHLENLLAARPEKIIEYYDLLTNLNEYSGESVEQLDAETIKKLFSQHCNKIKHRIAMNHVYLKEPGEAKKICDEIEPDYRGRGTKAPPDSLTYFIATSRQTNDLSR